ncbi:hypothetical protein B0T16DRAFT_325879 [Cercophora newfieldiana]|uniref:Chitin deacetylase n=1 Tax=Cercophora newfieldiana TaxID=92897 RepID=A0AA39Y8Y7_9PEZI|nr:hypothetical protein B0T16DRAFT_325879 [Cercophora newfieldiana]
MIAALAATALGSFGISFPHDRGAVTEGAHTERRDVQVGGRCGSTQGNAVCATGLCCSEEGVCGTGRDVCSSPACQLSFGSGCDGNKSPSGKDTSNVPRPLFGDVPYGIDIPKCTLPGKVALTFDDGPNKFTNELLDILKKYNAKATFFVTAANGGKGQIQDESSGFRDVVKRMHKEGHQIGSHSWSHENFVAISAEQRRDQIVKNEIALADILGFFPTYLRLPYSSWNGEVQSELKEFGYHSIDFNLDTQDWKDPNGNYQIARDSFSSAVSQHSPKDSSFIAVAHDIHEKTVRGYVQFMIEQAQKFKYDLVTVGECLDDPSNNWYRDVGTGQEWSGPAPRKGQEKSGTPTSTTSPSSTAGGGVQGTTAGSTPASTSSPGPKEGITSASGPNTTRDAAGTAATGTPKPSSAARGVYRLTSGVLLGYIVLFALV